MKMGFIVSKGAELEVKEEFEKLKIKAKEGYKDYDVEVVRIVEHRENSFTIVSEDIKINFQVNVLFGTEFAIFQIIS